MGSDHDDPHAARRAQMEELFTSLPAAGTPDYWRRIEQATAEMALPLEVLARCVRECVQAGAHEHVKRICIEIVGRIQHTVQRRMQSRARPYEPGQQRELARDLEQECYAQLLQELVDPEPTFFCEYFPVALKRLMDHVEHSVMEHEGYWKRRDVETPKRVPVSQQDPLDKPIAPGEPQTLEGSLTDPAAESEYEQVDLETDIAALKAALKPEDYDLIQDLFWRRLTRKQVAERLGVTEKTVYNHLQRILKQMRKDYFGREEDDHDE